MSLIVAFWIYLTPSFKDLSGNYPLYYFFLCICISALHSITSTILSVTMIAFFTQISDKSIGGTYMTLLNTLYNLGFYSFISKKNFFSSLFI